MNEKIANEMMANTAKKRRGRPPMTPEQKEEARLKRLALKEAKAKEDAARKEEAKKKMPKSDEELIMDVLRTGGPKMDIDDFLEEANREVDLSKMRAKKETETAKSSKKNKFVEMTPARRRALTTEVFGSNFESVGVREARAFYETHECPRELIGYMAKRYIQVQTDRIRVNGQRNAMLKSILEDMCAEQGVDDVKKLDYTEEQLYIDHPEMLAMSAAVSDAERMEDAAAKLLDAVTRRSCLAQYLRQIQGIGPVVAGLIAANIDITRFEYPSRLVSYAGLSNMNKWFGATEAKKYLDEAFKQSGTRIVTEEIRAQVEEAIRTLKDNSNFQYGNVVVSQYPDDILDHLETIKIHEDKLYEESIADGPFIDALHKIVAFLRSIQFVPDISDTVRARIVEAGGVIAADADINPFSEDLVEMLRTELSEAEESLMACKIDRDDLSDEFLHTLARLTYRSYNTILRYCTVVNEKTGEEERSYSELQVRLTKRPYNAALKRALYLFQDQVIKRHNNPKSLYGQLYNQFLEQEHILNENGGHKEAARWACETKKFSTNTKTYQCMKEGKLTEGHMMNRALRKVKVVLLNHIFEAAWFFEDPNGSHPMSYVFDELGHKDYVAPEVDYKEFYVNFYRDIPKGQ